MSSRDQTAATAYSVFGANPAAAAAARPHEAAESSDPFGDYDYHGGSGGGGSGGAASDLLHLSAGSTGDTPADILRFYSSFHAARTQLVSQSVSAVRLVHRCWTQLSLQGRAAEEREKAARSLGEKVGPAMGGARHSTLAASYMNLVAQQQEQQQAAQAAQAQAHAAQILQSQPEEGEEEGDGHDDHEQGDAVRDEKEGGEAGTRPTQSSTGVTSPRAPSAVARSPSLTHSGGGGGGGGGGPTSSSGGGGGSHSGSRPSTVLGTSEMERAVQNAHQNKLAKEALETAARRRAEEDQRQQSMIRLEQQALRQRNASGESAAGESPFIRLQQSSRDLPNEPLRVGIIGAGRIGAAIAEQILQQVCGLAPAPPATSATGNEEQQVPPPPPAVPAGATGVRLFISTRRPEHPSMIALLKRTGGVGGAGSALSSASHGAPRAPRPGSGGGGGGGSSAGGPLLTVYFDNARLVTECNVVLVCVLPHQVQLLSRTIRSLSAPNAPASQLFFSITSSHSMRSLRAHLGQTLALAQAHIVLPHLLHKGSAEALALQERFQSTLVGAAVQALQVHASFRHLLGPEAVARTVQACKRQLENEVAHCFVAQAAATAPAHPAPHAQHRGRSLHGSNVSAGQLRSSASLSTSASLSSLSASSYRPSGSGSGVGLTPPSFAATAGAPLPKLHELRAREQAAQHERQAARDGAGKGPASTHAPVPISTSANGRNMRRIDVNPNLALPAHVRLAQHATAPASTTAAVALMTASGSAAAAAHPSATPLKDAFSTKQRSQLFRAQI